MSKFVPGLGTVAPPLAGMAGVTVGKFLLADGLASLLYGGGFLCRANRDPSLAIRFSCINANACKECVVELDGKTVYACTERLAAREMKVAPLSNKKLVRDLVTEIAPPGERFGGR